MKELNKVIQDLKVEIEKIKKTQVDANLKMESLGKMSGITDVTISNRIQEIEERLSAFFSDFIVFQLVKWKFLIFHDFQCSCHISRPTVDICK